MSSLPLILLGSDYPRLAAPLHRALENDGMLVRFAPGYHELEPLTRAHEDGIVLIEVSNEQSVEEAVGLALRLKRQNAGRFVGYLADPVLHASGLTGDAIFPRSANYLPGVLRNYFASGR